MVMPLDPATFSSRRPVPGSPSGSSVAVTGSDGTVVGAWPAGLVAVGSTDGPSTWARGPGSRAPRSCPVPTGTSPWAWPSSLADEPLVELRTDLLVLLLGFAAIILATLWQVDRWLARPVRAMAALAEHAVQGGHVTEQRAEPGGGLEGAELAHGLNTLLDATTESLDNAHAVVGELTRVREAEKRVAGRGPARQRHPGAHRHGVDPRPRDRRRRRQPACWSRPATRSTRPSSACAARRST